MNEQSNFRFSIADFRLGEKSIKKRSWIRGLDFSFDNLKSKIQNRKWVGFLTIVLTLAMCGAVAQAQQEAKVAKIGWLFRAAAAARLDLFRRELRQLGYVEGKNIAIESRFTEPNRLSTLIDELVRLKVDVLVTGSTTDALAAKNANNTIPIVFYNVTDPVASGLVDSLARPGGNITGITNLQGVLAGKRLELLKETVPKLSHVAVLWNPADLNAVQQWKESQLPARELGLQLYSMEVSSTEKFESAFKVATKAGAAALAVIGSPLIGLNQNRIVGLAAKNRLPAIYPRGEYVTNGGLMSYGADEAEPVKRAAVFVDKILKGTKPADIPVEQPTKFELAINLKTAKALGLTIPPVVLMRAEKVIK